MDREFKIVSSIFMLFLIFGLSSIYYNGSFVTPIFLNQLVLLGVAVAFFIMNRQAKSSWILGVYILIQCLSCLVDGFTMGFLAEKFNNELLVTIYESETVSYLFIVFYFSFMLFLVIYSYLKHKLKLLLAIMIGLIIATLVFFFLPDLTTIRDIIFLTFLLFYYVSINRVMPNEDSVISVMANQLLLIFFLEGLEYFH